MTRAVGENRPLLAARGFATLTGVRLHTLADVFAYAAAEDVEIRDNGTEMRYGAHRRTNPDAASSSRAIIDA